ncbi:MAG: DNA mismatch repair endonuclease MutL, partial [Candidatus Zixiibacteriota bacterium]
FRGDALPSIASVSRLRMVSRTHSSPTGTGIIYEGGVLQSSQPVAAPPGTLVEVENLFFNTPARRKFLRAETTEARHIARIATAFAVGCHDVGFVLKINGREVFAFPPHASLQSRVAGLLGKESQFVTVVAEEAPLSVKGCIGTPELLQNNRYGQFIFINGRYVFSPVLSHAFASGYGELLPKGMYPVGALLITVDPTEVDVNVHPAKTEVRLSREREIHDTVSHLIKEALRREAVIPSYSTAESSTTAPVETVGHQLARPHRESPGHLPGIVQKQENGVNLLRELYRSTATAPSRTSERVAKVDLDTGEVLSETRASESPVAMEPADSARLLGQ